MKKQQSLSRRTMCQRDTKIFCCLVRLFELNLESEPLRLIPEKANCWRRVIQQLCYLAVNDRMCQIMNNELDHASEEEGLRRSSKNVRVHPAIIKLRANSWEQNQVMSFSSKLVPNPAHTQKNTQVSLYKTIWNVAKQSHFNSEAPSARYKKKKKKQWEFA